MMHKFGLENNLQISCALVVVVVEVVAAALVVVAEP